jgi:hypothetical protein
MAIFSTRSLAVLDPVKSGTMLAAELDLLVEKKPFYNFLRPNMTMLISAQLILLAYIL